MGPQKTGTLNGSKLVYVCSSGNSEMNETICKEWFNHPLLNLVEESIYNNEQCELSFRDDK